MTNYTIVDKETCMACGACSEIAPDIYGLDEEGVAFVKLDNNDGTAAIPKEIEEDMFDAREECPIGAIKIAQKPFDGNPFKFE